MSREIDDYLMRPTIGGRTAAAAGRRPEGWWNVSNWQRFFDRGRAITALTIAELLETGGPYSLANDTQ